MQVQTKTWKKSILKVLLVPAIGLALTGAAYAATAMSIGQVAAQITTSMSDLAKLITAGAYVAGFGFAVGAILKFKAHKDNPTQIPVGTPIALLFIAAALIFLPAIFGMAGMTMFDSTSNVGGISGVTTFSGGGGGGGGGGM